MDEFMASGRVFIGARIKRDLLRRATKLIAAFVLLEKLFSQSGREFPSFDARAPIAVLMNHAGIGMSNWYNSHVARPLLCIGMNVQLDMLRKLKKPGPDFARLYFAQSPGSSHVSSLFS
jgi:hypothetical protein